MDEVEVRKLAEYIRALTVLTTERQARWMRANPTTFVWSKQDEARSIRAQVILQKVSVSRKVQVDQAGRMVERIVPKAAYVLQVTDSSGRGQVLSINSAEESRLESELEALFNAVAAASSVDGIDFFGSLVR